MAGLLGLWVTACSGYGTPTGQGGEGGTGGEGLYGPGGPGPGGAGAGAGSGGSTSTSGSTDTSTGQGGGTGGTGGGGPFVLDPGQYDCTASKPPARVNPIPLACTTDPSCPTTLLSGSRAAGGPLGVIAPPNTLAAARAAIVMGLDYIDTDPRATKDDVLVNLQHPELSMTTNGAGLVSDLTLAQVQSFTVFADDVLGDPLPGDFTCETVPTLEQVLATAKDKLAVLVDADTTDRVDLLVEAIQKTNMLEQAIFDSASLAKIDEALMLEPDLRISVRVTSKSTLQAALDHLADHPPVLVQIADGASPVVLTPAIHTAGHRALQNVFGADASATFDGVEGAYDQTLVWGIDVLQSSRPDLALVALDRWPPPPQPE